MTVVPSALDSDSCDTAIRASFLHFKSDPDLSGDAHEYLEDGLLILKQGRVQLLVDAPEWVDHLPDGTVFYDYSGRLVMPGFIDTHTHYPQSEMIASYGLQLLDWLEQYTYPTEAKFAEREYADKIAEFFCDQMLRNGTTTSAVFATVHSASVDAIFEAAQSRDLCLIAGKVMMDRNAPANLCDDTEESYRQCAELIERWHLKGRSHYAVTPRFAPCSSSRQLELCGQLLDENPDLYLQSHVAENLEEVRWVAELFPKSRSYLDVYDSFGLLGPRSVYGHCIHLDEQDRERMAESGAAIAFCPTSNLFLGSGLFRNEAYKVCQLAGQSLTPLKAFYLATLGAAESLYLDHGIGNFNVGKEADLVVIDLQATELMQKRMESAQSLEERLFALMMLGDDRCIQATHVMGRRQYSRVG
jgi:guanine deaminase